MNLRFPAQVAATDLFRVKKRRLVNIEAYSSNWNSATLKLTVDRTNGSGTYHSLYPSTDPTTPLTGAEFVLTGNWNGTLDLGAGFYGITVATGTPTDPIKVSICDASGGLERGSSFDTYDY